MNDKKNLKIFDLKNWNKQKKDSETVFYKKETELNQKSRVQNLILAIKGASLVVGLILWLQPLLTRKTRFNRSDEVLFRSQTVAAAVSSESFHLKGAAAISSSSHWLQATQQKKSQDKNETSVQGGLSPSKTTSLGTLSSALGGRRETKPKGHLPVVVQRQQLQVEIKTSDPVVARFHSTQSIEAIRLAIKDLPPEEVEAIQALEKEYEQSLISFKKVLEKFDKLVQGDKYDAPVTTEQEEAFQELREAGKTASQHRSKIQQRAKKWFEENPVPKNPVQENLVLENPVEENRVQEDEKPPESSLEEFETLIAKNKEVSSESVEKKEGSPKKREKGKTLSEWVEMGRKATTKREQLQIWSQILDIAERSRLEAGPDGPEECFALFWEAILPIQERKSRFEKMADKVGCGPFCGFSLSTQCLDPRASSPTQHSIGISSTENPNSTVHAMAKKIRDNKFTGFSPIIKKSVVLDDFWSRIATTKNDDQAWKLYKAMSPKDREIVITLINDFYDYCLQDPKPVEPVDFLYSSKIAKLMTHYKGDKASIKKAIEVFLQTSNAFRDNPGRLLKTEEKNIPIKLKFKPYAITWKNMRFLRNFTAEKQAMIRQKLTSEYTDSQERVEIHHFTLNSLGGPDTRSNARVVSGLEHAVLHGADELDRVYRREVGGVGANTKIFSRGMWGGKKPLSTK